MKRILLLSVVLASLPSAPAVANQPVSSNQNKPEIVTDAKTNTVRILIDGKEIVRIDAAGLHVTGDLTYTGTEADVGTSREDEPRK